MTCEYCGSDKHFVHIPSFVGFTEDGTLLIRGDDPEVKANPKKFRKWDRRFKGKKRIFTRMNVDGKAS